MTVRRAPAKDAAWAHDAPPPLEEPPVAEEAPLPPDEPVPPTADPLPPEPPGDDCVGLPTLPIQAAKAMTAQKPPAVSHTLAALRADPFPCWFGFVMLALSQWIDV